MEKSLSLKIIATYAYRMNVGTETENLKLSTIPGEEEGFSYLWNEESASIDNIVFFSTAPQG